MSTWTIKTQTDVTQLCEALGRRKKPFVVEVKKKGSQRSTEQNRLQFLWINEAAEQLQEDTAEGYRAYCKLHFAVPILRNENDEFREAYDRYIRPLDYETKLAFMAVPLDFPCTRLMTVDQKTRYLNMMQDHFRGLGVLLTEPPSDWSI